MRRPAELLAKLEVHAHLDFGYLVISHIGTDFLPDESALAEAVAVYERASERVWPRSREEILSFLDGFELLEPGLVPKHHWRPSSDPRWPYGRRAPDPFGSISCDLPIPHVRSRAWHLLGPCDIPGQWAASRSARYRTRVSPSRCRRVFSSPAIGTRFCGARESLYATDA